MTNVDIKVIGPNGVATFCAATMVMRGSSKGKETYVECADGTRLRVSDLNIVGIYAEYQNSESTLDIFAGVTFATVQKVIYSIRVDLNLSKEYFEQATASISAISMQNSVSLSNEELVDRLAQVIPGLFKVVQLPVQDPDITGGRWSLKDAIIRLNDIHKWSYQQIADWLDTLDIDLSVQPIKTGKTE